MEEERKRTYEPSEGATNDEKRLRPGEAKPFSQISTDLFCTDINSLLTMKLRLNQRLSPYKN